VLDDGDEQEKPKLLCVIKTKANIAVVNAPSVSDRCAGVFCADWTTVLVVWKTARRTTWRNLVSREQRQWHRVALEIDCSPKKNIISVFNPDFNFYSILSSFISIEQRFTVPACM